MLYYPRGDGGVPYPQTSGNNRVPSELRIEDDSEVWRNRDLRTVYVEHAERAAIYAAAREGICTDRLGMVATWAACADCARAIIASGIREVLTDVRSFSRATPDWLETVSAGHSMLRSAGVNVILYQSGPIVGKVRHGGDTYIP